jgi:hypothetical protein
MFLPPAHIAVLLEWSEAHSVTVWRRHERPSALATCECVHRPTAPRRYLPIKYRSGQIAQRAELADFFRGEIRGYGKTAKSPGACGSAASARGAPDGLLLAWQSGRPGRSSLPPSPFYSVSNNAGLSLDARRRRAGGRPSARREAYSCRARALPRARLPFCRAAPNALTSRPDTLTRKSLR